MWNGSDEIGAFSSAMLYFKSDKDMPERTFLFSDHIQSTLRGKDKHLNQGKAEDGTGTHSFSPSTSAASCVHYIYRQPLPGPLPPLLCRVNDAAWAHSCSIFICRVQCVALLAPPHSAETLHLLAPAAHRAAGGQQLLSLLCLAECWKRWCLRYLKILPFSNTIQWEERHLIWEGSFAGFVWSVFVLNDVSEKGEGLSCSEGIHVKQSATGISQRFLTFTHFSKSKTALSPTSVWFKLG